FEFGNDSNLYIKIDKDKRVLDKEARILYNSKGEVILSDVDEKELENEDVTIYGSMGGTYTAFFNDGSVESFMVKDIAYLNDRSKIFVYLGEDGELHALKSKTERLDKIDFLSGVRESFPVLVKDGIVY